MKFFLLSTCLNIKKILNLNNPAYLAFILLPLFIFLAATFMPAQNLGINLSVGVHHHYGDPLQKTIAQQLEEFENPFISFIIYNDLDQLRQDIRLGRLNMGYTFAPYINWAEPNREIVTVIVSPRTIGTPIVNEILSAFIIEAAMPKMTIAALERFFPYDYYIEEFVENQIIAYGLSDIFMAPDMVGRDNLPREYVPPNPVEIIQTRLYNGFVGLTILSLLIFILPPFIKEKSRGNLSPLKYHKKTLVYYLSLWACFFIITFFLGLVGFLSITFFSNQVVSGIIPLIIYTGISSFLAVACALTMKTDDMIQSFGVFIIILNIFFGGVVVDFYEINEFLGGVQRGVPLWWFVGMGL